MAELTIEYQDPPSLAPGMKWERVDNPNPDVDVAWNTMGREPVTIFVSKKAPSTVLMIVGIQSFGPYELPEQAARKLLQLWREDFCRLGRLLGRGTGSLLADSDVSREKAFEEAKAYKSENVVDGYEFRDGEFGVEYRLAGYGDWMAVATGSSLHVKKLARRWREARK